MNQKILLKTPYMILRGETKHALIRLFYAKYKHYDSLL